MLTATTFTTRRTLLAAGLGGLAATTVARTAFAQTPPPPPDPNLPDGLVGQFHPGVGKGRRPGMLVLGGSEGGLTSGAAGAKRLHDAIERIDTLADVGDLARASAKA